MENIAQEPLGTQVEQAITTVLCEAADRLARPTGLIQRQKKVTGSKLAQTLVFSWMADPNASLEMMAQHAAEVGLQITAQGIDERFTDRAAVFFQQVFEVALAQVVVADPVAIPLLNRFSGVYLEDSSTIGLPAELESVFQGKGGKGKAAACKLFVRLDMLRRGLTCGPLQQGRRADTASPLKGLPTPARALHLRDRGFTDVTRWSEELAREELVLSYLRSDVGVYDSQGKPLDLVECLPQADSRGEWKVLIGSHHRLPMRLLFEKVPEEVAKERRRRGKREAEVRGQKYSQRASFLAGWTIVVTTVPEDLLSLAEALVLLRLRWQIELLFKLWKQQGCVDEWRTQKGERILCELYAKLIGLLIQHWLLIISCWHEPHRSLVKAAQAVRRQVALLSAALDGDLDLGAAIRRIQRVARAGARLNSRRDAPNTSQMLFTGRSQWSSKPLRNRRWT